MRIANGRSSLHNGVLIRKRTKDSPPVDQWKQQDWESPEAAGPKDEDELSLSFLPYLNSYVDLEQFIYWLFYGAEAYTTLIIIIYTLKFGICVNVNIYMIILSKQRIWI